MAGRAGGRARGAPARGPGGAGRAALVLITLVRGVGVGRFAAGKRGGGDAGAVCALSGLGGGGEGDVGALQQIEKSVDESNVRRRDCVSKGC